MNKYRILMVWCVANVEMKVFEFVALFSLIVVHSNVKAFLYDLFSTKSDPYTVYCRDDADCLRDIDPPCFCIHMQHICGCQHYGIGTIHQDIIKRKDPVTSKAPVLQNPNECSRKDKNSKKTKKTKKPHNNYIDDDMIRKMDQIFFRN